MNVEDLMESRGLSESDREEIRAQMELLTLRAGWQRTGTEEAERAYLEALDRALERGRRADGR